MSPVYYGAHIGIRCALTKLSDPLPETPSRRRLQPALRDGVFILKVSLIMGTTPRMSGIERGKVYVRVDR